MDKTIRNHEDIEVQQLLKTLGSKNGMERKKARKKLVEMGNDVLNPLAGMFNHPEYIFGMEKLHHPDHIYRWEALKTTVEIGDPISISFFIQALDDDESDIRWMATEGLIKLGMQSVKPLLEKLLENSDSIFVLAGIHHVFSDLRKNKKLPKGFPIKKLLSGLKNNHILTGSIKPLADRILNDLEY